MKYCKSPREFPREIFTNDVFSALAAIIKQQEFIMAAIDDLNTAVTDAVTTMGAAVDAINALRGQVGAGNGVTDDQLAGLASQLTTAQSGLAAAVTPPAPPADAAPAAS